MGGCIAQTFVLKYPHDLDILIFVATYANMEQQAELFLNDVLDVYENGATPKQRYNLISECATLLESQPLAGELEFG